MKRLISVVLIMVMILSLYACSTNNQVAEPTKSLEAVRVDRMIDSIGEVTLDSESKILEAEQAVEALSDEDYSQLEQLQVLKDARAAYNELSESVLDGADKVAFDLIMHYAYSFKNPSSIRLVSGTANDWESGIFAFLCISATNGFGATTNGYYYMSYAGMDDVGSSSRKVALCQTTGELNVAKINKALERELGIK